MLVTETKGSVVLGLPKASGATNKRFIFAFPEISLEGRALRKGVIPIVGVAVGVEFCTRTE